MAALENDNAASVEELLKIALGRLERTAGKGEAQRAGMPEDLSATLPGTAAGDVAAAVQILERASVERPAELLERLGPLLKATCARVGIDLQEYLFLLRSR